RHRRLRRPYGDSGPDLGLRRKEIAMRRAAWLPLVLFCLACDMPPDPTPPPVDPNIIVPCTGRGGRCSQSSDCCDILTCDSNSHACTDGACFDKGMPCGSNSDCCGTLTCDPGIHVCSDGTC